jgi:hypothetical protein
MNKSEEIPFPVNSKEFYHRREAAFDVPIRLAFATGMIVFLAVGALGLIWGWTYTIKIAGTLAAIAFLGSWILFVSIREYDSRPDKLHVPQPAETPPARIVRVRFENITKDKHLKIENFDLPGEPDALRMLATGVLKGHRPFTEEIWAGKNKPFSIPEFRELRKRGMKLGFFEYVNPKAPAQGIKLTEKGEALFAEFADGDMDEFEASPTDGRA